LPNSSVPTCSPWSQVKTRVPKEDPRAMSAAVGVLKPPRTISAGPDSGKLTRSRVILANYQSNQDFLQFDIGWAGESGVAAMFALGESKRPEERPVSRQRQADIDAQASRARQARLHFCLRHQGARDSLAPQRRVDRQAACIGESRLPPHRDAAHELAVMLRYQDRTIRDQ